MKKIVAIVKQFFHVVVARIVPGNLTLSNGIFGRWYKQNSCYIFPKEAFVKLKHRSYFGYGTRPIGRVVGYESDGQEDFYIIEMETDVTTKWARRDFDEYLKTGIVKGVPVRKKEVQKHFKWNIEHNFVRT